MVFQKATKKRAKLRMALCGASGSGKTYSALLIASGVTGKDGKIAVIDTERGSAELYSGLCNYDVAQINQPFSPEKYIAAIQEAEKAGYDVLIIDSLSHAWSGEGGVLSLHDKATKMSRSGNSFTAWREVTPIHNKLVDTILGANLHIICTMRTKQEYAQEKDEKGKTVIKKLGMAPIQREGMDYEFTLVLDLSNETHYAKPSKDRTGLIDGQTFVPTMETGEVLVKWLNEGDEPAPIPEKKPAESEPQKPTQSFRRSDVKANESAPAREPLADDAAIKRYRDSLKRLQSIRKWENTQAVEFHHNILKSVQASDLKSLTVARINQVIELIEKHITDEEQKNGDSNAIN